MIDIHNHILYEIDDGSSSRDETTHMLKIAVDDGIESIIATPHYIIGGNQYNREDLLERYQEVCDIIDKENIPIKLILGNELFADAMLPGKIVDEDCFTLGNSQYVLVEFSLRTPKQIIENLIYKISLKGYTPIIAHPERTFTLKENQDMLMELIKRGCFFQLNAGSITGFYGDRVKKIANELLERQMIHFVASDAHSNRRRSPKLKKAYHIISEKYGEKYAHRLFVENGLKVLSNATIDYVEPVSTRNNSFIKRLKYIFNMKL